jgi:hypothetical protein
MYDRAPAASWFEPVGRNSGSVFRHFRLSIGGLRQRQSTLRCFAAKLVVPGLVPGIHVLAELRKTWMAGTKPGHDEENESVLEH